MILQFVGELEMPLIQGDGDMWNSASTLGVITNLFTDTGVILGIVIGSITTTVIALMGLYFAYDKLCRYVFDSWAGDRYSRRARMGQADEHEHDYSLWRRGM